MKFKDIAKIVDRPLGTVLWLYNKAIKTLQEYLKVEVEK
jgi:RNA polymerase sigma-70 factor (ECF subfamily)